MNRRDLLIFGWAALAAGPAFAAYEDDIIAALRQQGYTDISVTTTWLGRIRITAIKNAGQREIVLNPRTGEILRDMWLTGGESASGLPQVKGQTSVATTTQTGPQTGGDDGSDGSSGSSGSGSSGSGSSGSGGSGNGGSDDDSSDDSDDDTDDDKDDDKDDSSDDKDSEGKDD